MRPKTVPTQLATALFTVCVLVTGLQLLRITMPEDRSIQSSPATSARRTTASDPAPGNIVGRYTGAVGLERVAAGVLTDTLPVVTVVPKTTPVPGTAAEPELPLPDLGAVDLALELEQNGTAVDGFVDLGSSLVFEKQHSIFVTPGGPTPELGTPAPTPHSLDIGPRVRGTFDGTNLNLISEQFAQVIAKAGSISTGQARPDASIKRQFRLSAVALQKDTDNLQGEYRETVWGSGPAPFTIIGHVTLNRPLLVIPTPGTPLPSPTGGGLPTATTPSSTPQPQSTQTRPATLQPGVTRTPSSTPQSSLTRTPPATLDPRQPKHSVYVPMLSKNR